ncbi:hypothetical protein M501DRAFT_172599 [Patellaria atrata CBS 101060]|uniref:Uncharacterized protein n=1 Tax=Patellaria atrata CBS 101060 TaxID=1346257 RepID=A0A9P4S7H5_9PEZI|nr:hypothetical protein M501DRAFT_172599 [Patellaria atrata CBS 101060]
MSARLSSIQSSVRKPINLRPSDVKTQETNSLIWASYSANFYISVIYLGYIIARVQYNNDDGLIIDTVSTVVPVISAKASLYLYRSISPSTCALLL